MTHYGVSTDYEWARTHKTDRLTIWSGPFMSVYEGEAGRKRVVARCDTVEDAQMIAEALNA